MLDLIFPHVFSVADHLVIFVGVVPLFLFLFGFHFTSEIVCNFHAIRLFSYIVAYVVLDIITDAHIVGICRVDLFGPSSWFVDAVRLCACFVGHACVCVFVIFCVSGAPFPKTPVFPQIPILFCMYNEFNETKCENWSNNKIYANAYARITYE